MRRLLQEVEAGDAIPSRDKFIDDLKVSPELKEWLKAHEILDLTMPGLDKALTADDVLHVPEFLLAYQRSNSGGVTNGIPKPKYKDADKTDHPEKYEKQKEEYYSGAAQVYSVASGNDERDGTGDGRGESAAKMGED